MYGESHISKKINKTVVYSQLSYILKCVSYPQGVFEVLLIRAVVYFLCLKNKQIKVF